MYEWEFGCTYWNKGCAGGEAVYFRDLRKSLEDMCVSECGSLYEGGKGIQEFRDVSNFGFNL